MVLLTFLKKKKNYLAYISLVIFFSLLYLLYKNLATSISIVKIPFFSFLEKINLFFLAFFDVSELRYFPMLILVVLLIISLALFFLLTWLLYKESQKIKQGKNLFSFVSIFLSILGISCASCGIGLLVSILSFFGASSLLIYFPWHGLELGYLGLIFLNISNYFLLKRIRNPFVC